MKTYLRIPKKRVNIYILPKAKNAKYTFYDESDKLQSKAVDFDFQKYFATRQTRSPDLLLYYALKNLKIHPFRKAERIRKSKQRKINKRGDKQIKKSVKWSMKQPQTTNWIQYKQPILDETCRVKNLADGKEYTVEEWSNLGSSKSIVQKQISL